jgi:Zn-finger protein
MIKKLKQVKNCKICTLQNGEKVQFKILMKLLRQRKETRKRLNSKQLLQIKMKNLKITQRN